MIVFKVLFLPISASNCFYDFSFFFLFDFRSLINFLLRFFFSVTIFVMMIFVCMFM